MCHMKNLLVAMRLEIRACMRQLVTVSLNTLGRILLVAFAVLMSAALGVPSPDRPEGGGHSDGLLRGERAAGWGDVQPAQCGRAAPWREDSGAAHAAHALSDSPLREAREGALCVRADLRGGQCVLARRPSACGLWRHARVDAHALRSGGVLPDAEPARAAAGRGRKETRRIPSSRRCCAPSPG